MGNTDDELGQLEERLRSGRATEFINAVTTARAQHADMILMTMQAFLDEPDLLYAALRYAYLQGMEVRMVPQGSDAAAA